jgi:hypothetical protein
MPICALFGRSLSAPVDPEVLGTLGPNVNEFNDLALTGRSSLGVNVGRPALTYSLPCAKDEPFQTASAYGSAGRSWQRIHDLRRLPAAIERASRVRSHHQQRPSISAITL